LGGALYSNDEDGIDMNVMLHIKRMAIASLFSLAALVLVHLWRHGLSLGDPIRNMPFLYIGLFLNFVWCCIYLLLFVYKKATALVMLKVIFLGGGLTLLIMVVFFIIMLNIIGS
jgi:hypothetical protein